VETIVKATGDKIGSLCFQLQMTGYVSMCMCHTKFSLRLFCSHTQHLQRCIAIFSVRRYMFRNVEYVIALKNLMKIQGSATLQDYKDAFGRLDGDNSGYIETSEVAELLDDVYDGKTPAFEINAFMRFFDQDSDGKISWQEFERGLGAAMAKRNGKTSAAARKRLLGSDHHDDDDEVAELGEPEVSGTVKLELEDGKIVEVDAKEYLQNLKDEARALKDALHREHGTSSEAPADVPEFLAGPQTPADEYGGITGYIASLRGNVKALTEGISPEIVETMKMLVDFVLEGGESGKGKAVPKEQMEMEIPGSALQQLALWQLILGYRLREAEAKGDYLKLLE